MKSMKGKLVCLFLAAVLCAGLLPAGAAADTPCDHSWYVDDRDSAYKPATCTDSGTVVYVCAACGKSYEEKVPALGHSWNGGVITRQPTCSQEGVCTYTCTRCGVTTTEAIARTAHTPVTVPGYGATCTEKGMTDGQKCAVCGQILKAQEEMEPIGHRWNDGEVVKEAEGFTDGEMLYTCLNDPTHTKTETVSAVSNLFGKLRWNPTPHEPADPDNPLRITLQPEGGSVRRFPSDWFGFETRMAECCHTFTVAVEGGKEPYTYEWHRVNVEQYDAWTATMEANGVEFPEKDNPYDKIVWTTESPQYTESIGGNTYYCVISDADGWSIESNAVKLKYDLAIWKQPVNNNYHNEPTGLTCEVIDGQPPYTFRWYRVTEEGDKDDGSAADEYELTEVLPGRGSLLHPQGAMEYYCVIQDDAGAEVTSHTATVYSAEELVITSLTPSAKSIVPGQETVTVKAAVTGGRPPYTGAFEGWNLDYTEVPSAEEDGETVFTVEVTEDDPELRFTVTDSMHKSTEAFVEVFYKQLEIAKQPEGGRLPYQGTFPLSVEMAEGTAPFTYKLYRLIENINGSEISWFHHEETKEDDNTFYVDEPGLYYIYITDAAGRWAETETVKVETGSVHIYSYTPKTDIPDAEHSARLSCWAVGGRDDEDYSFAWYRWYEAYGEAGGFAPVSPEINSFVLETGQKKGDESGYPAQNGYNLPAQLGYMDVTVPGKYRCRVQDADGNTAWTKTMTVTYAGTKPLFLQQPSDQIIPYKNGSGSCTLSCAAIATDGNDKYISYAWEKLVDGYWLGENGWDGFVEFTAGSSKTKTLTLQYGLGDWSKGMSWEYAEAGGFLPTGVYRCRAYNWATGESTCSNPVTVVMGMEQYETEEIKVSETKINKILSFRGGLQPYTISVWQKTSYEGSDPKDGSRITAETETEYDVSEGSTTWKIGEPQDEGVVTVTARGLPANPALYRYYEKEHDVYLTGFKYEYKVTVSDSSGQSVTFNWEQNAE